MLYEVITDQFSVFFSGVADAETETASIHQVYFGHVGFGGSGPGPEGGAAVGFENPGSECCFNIGRITSYNVCYTKLLRCLRKLLRI